MSMNTKTQFKHEIGYIIIKPEYINLIKIIMTKMSYVALCLLTTAHPATITITYTYTHESRRINDKILNKYETLLLTLT